MTFSLGTQKSQGNPRGRQAEDGNSSTSFSSSFQSLTRASYFQKLTRSRGKDSTEASYVGGGEGWSVEGERQIEGI